MAAGTARSLLIERAEALRHHESVTADSARFVAEHARRTIESADLVLRQAVEAVAERGGADRLGSDADWTVLTRLAAHLPDKGFLWVFDAEGNTRLATLDHPPPTVNVADRSYFQAHEAGAADPHIGPAVHGRASGATIFTVSRALRDGEGRLTGVVMAGLNVSYFTGLYDLLDPRLDPLLGIYRSDGAVLVRRPNMEAAVGMIMRDAPVFERLRNHPAGTVDAVSPVDGVERIVSYRAVPGLPLVVIAGVAREEALAEWRGRAVRSVRFGIGVGAVLLALAAAGWAGLRREDRLARRNSLLATAVEASSNAILVTDATADEPRVLYANRAFETLTGYTAEEIAGRSARILYGPETDERIVAMVRAAVDRDETVAAEAVNYRKDGTTFHNRARIAPVRDAEGRTVAHVAVLWDITDERRREAEERQRQRMEALGQLAGGIAHEINNLLQPIVTLADLNLKQAGQQGGMRGGMPDGVEEDFRDILDSARQCREVVGAVLAFARRESRAAEPLCLAEAVAAALALARNGLPPTIDIRSELRSGEATAPIGRTELTQLLMNLLTNAADAMDGAGTVTVVLELAEAEDGDGRHRPCFRLSVRDHGCGMGEAERLRIFEPFFTTKPPGKGTGMGLSVVHGIVRSWHGTIAVDSTPGRGTMFTITIPATGPAPDHAVGAAPA